MGDKSVNRLNNCNTIEPKVVISLSRSNPSTHTHTHTLKHSLMHRVHSPSGCSPNWHIGGSSRRQVWPRQLCLCLSEAAGGDSTAAQGEHPMRHVWIWSLRSGERPKDRQGERERWVRESEGVKLEVTDTHREREKIITPCGVWSVKAPTLVQYDEMCEWSHRC